MATFLIVDPNPVTRSLLKNFLSDAGHRVEAVGSIMAARGALATLQPNRVLVEAGHARAPEFVRELEAGAGLPRALLCLVVAPEDFEALRACLPLPEYQVAERGLDDAAFLQQLTKGVAADSIDAEPPPSPSATKQAAEPESPIDSRSGALSPVLDVYKELGVDSGVSTRLLLYCDLHRIEDVVAPLSAPERKEICSTLLAKAQDPVVSHDGELCAASRHGIAALFGTSEDDEGRSGGGFRVAVEMVYIAQQFHSWLRQRFPGHTFARLPVCVALDVVEVDTDWQAGEELDPDLKTAITRVAQFASLGAKRGWSLTATRAAIGTAADLCHPGESVTVRVGHNAAELFEVTTLALDSTSTVQERIGRIMHENAALLRPPLAKASSTSDATGPNHATIKPAQAPPAPGPQAVATTPSARPKNDVPAGIVDPETGICVPGYRIIRPLGKGGMAEVFLASHIQTGQERVLKMLSIVDGEEEQLQRFIQEYALIRQIQDPNVATIYEQGFTLTHAYIAMEYLSGGEFRAVVKRGLTVEQALDWTQAIAGALVAVHAKGITHRDLKPANLMLRADGSLALADFGIAKGQSELLSRTANGHIVGSPYYLSPEQAESKPVDARCDLYSLGVMLFEMLTGTKPYRAANLSDLIRQHVVAPIPRLPEDLSQFQPLIDHLLAKKPSDRLASAQLLLNELKVLRSAYERTHSDISPPPTQHTDTSKPQTALREVYTVAVIGFDETEKIVIASTLGLSVRRTPKFVEFDDSHGPRPDLYLVDARDMLYLQTMLASNLDRSVPTVLIGNSDFGTRWPVLKRPIQWAKIFEAFDRILHQYAMGKASVPA